MKTKKTKPPRNSTKKYAPIKTKTTKSTKTSRFAFDRRFKSINTFINSIEPQQMRKFAKDTIFHHSPEMRASSAHKLRRFKKAAIPVLKYALFDSDRTVREIASNALADYLGYRAVADLITKKYPKNTLGELPSEFFSDSPIAPNTRAKLRSKGSLPVREQLKSGKPFFLHRGLPVFIVNAPKAPLGRYIDGAIFINGSKKDLPAKFRKAVAEHEFGETFSHRAGNALMMLQLEKEGSFKEFIESYPGIGNEFHLLIMEDPKGFKEFRKYFS